MLDDVGEKRFIQLPSNFSVPIAGRSSHKLHIDCTRAAVCSKSDRSERIANKPPPINTHMFEKPTIFQCKNESFKIAQLFRIFSGIWIYNAIYYQQIAMKLE